MQSFQFDSSAFSYDTTSTSVWGEYRNCEEEDRGDPGVFVYVSDFAMVTEQNLEAIGDNHFITRLPTSYDA